MSPVVPLDTQRYQSGNYTLEITARRSALSQWSDRPVVRQLRFSLWLEQPDQRRRLATGDQDQLLNLSHAVETYVQTRLNQQAWDQTHRLILLGKKVRLNTLELFNLAEVLNLCSQHQITLPMATPKQQQSRRKIRGWLTGSAAASLLIALGVTTVYLHHRPTAFEQTAAVQAPEAVFDDAPLSETYTLPSRPESESSSDLSDLTVEERQELAQQPLDTTELESSSGLNPVPNRSSEQAAQPTNTEPAQAESGALSIDESAAIERAAPEPSPTSQPGLDLLPEVTEGPVAPAPSTADNFFEESNRLEGLSNSGADRPDEPTLQRSQSAETQIIDADALLGAIAIQLAPYQPTDVTYPLVYHGQIAPDGTIFTLEPISQNAPSLTIPATIKVPASGRPIQIEVTYTGATQPTVRER